MLSIQVALRIQLSSNDTNIVIFDSKLIRSDQLTLSMRKIKPIRRPTGGSIAFKKFF